MKRKRGHASVEEHPKGSGKYRVRARVQGKPKTLLSGVSEREATAAADAYAVHRRALDIREGITLADFGEAFLDRRERLQGLRSVREDRNRWKNYVTKDPIGNIPISALRTSDLIEWRDRLLGRRTRRKKPMAAATVKNALNLVRVALSEGVERELCPSNVAKDIKVPKGRSATTELGLGGVLLPHEQTALLAAVPRHHQPMVLFALATGLRWSEISWLRWEDVGDEAVNVRRSRKGGPTKAGRPRRLPLLGPALLAIEDAAATRKDGSPWVFPGPRSGEPRTYVPSHWRAWLAAAGIEKHVRFHDLRHTTATSLLAGWWGRKWSLDEVRQALGHGSVQVTERYAKLLDESLSTAVRETSGPSFPSGNGGGVSAGNLPISNAFVNRRSGVQIPKLAPPQLAPHSEQLQDADPIDVSSSLGTNGERSLTAADADALLRVALRLLAARIAASMEAA